MPNSAPSIQRSPASRSSVALTRASLFKFLWLLVGVFCLASYLLVYLANDLDRIEQKESEFYTKKAIESLEKSVLSTVKDYAFWGDAYRHLHTTVDTDWAYVRQNVGPTLYSDFGFQGMFVVNDADRTVYAVINGQLQSVDAAQWLQQSLRAILDKARAGAQTETPMSTFINVGGVPALVAAAAITPGTDPTVSRDDRSPSVLIFVDVLESARLQALGDEFGVDDLRVATVDELGGPSVYALGQDGSASSVHWNPPRPSQRLMGLGLPLIGIAALLVCLMTWVILRRTTSAAKALDASYASLQHSQAALATSEARFRDVVEASSDWVWEIDPGWRFTFLSDRFEEVTGLHRARWIGAAMDDLLRTELGTVSQWLSIPKRRPEISVQCRYVDT